METSNSGAEKRKKEARKMLGQFDEETERQYETVENDVFDHRTRNAALQNGEFSPPSGTLFEAIFLELKRKEQREKNRHSFSGIISRLHARDRSK